ncbi:MAG: ATP-dependent Clp protease ATP-binding subunit [Candidatus Harrisonbacteria bacterium]|nr:ATP-dependent Clp protease ATP-binding subunit [Candidatus Harrisonbacteria bacterium]
MRKLDPDKFSEEAEKLREFMRARIKGQDKTIDDLVDMFDLYNSGLKDPEKPIYIVLFLGPSGVGKTLMAEVLAEYLFGSRKAFTKVACAQYSEPHRVADLIGSPPGYVGFYDPSDPMHRGTEPQLSQWNIDRHDYLSRMERLKKSRKYTDDKKREAVLFDELQKIGGDGRGIFRNRDDRGKSGDRATEISKEIVGIRIKYAYDPEKNIYRSVLLFDEVEKAYETLHNLLLEIMDKGTIKLANGDVTRFNQSVILMTSNVGSKQISDILKGRRGMGFKHGEGVETVDKEIYSRASEELYNVFRPEFLGRFNRISVFRPLSREILLQIFDWLIQEVVAEMVAKKFPVFLKFDQEVKEFVVDEASDRPQSGARLLRNKISKYIREPLGRLKNRGEVKANDVVLVKFEEGSGKKKIVFYKEESAA